MSAAAEINETDEKKNGYDPFKERVQEQQTSDMETFTVLFKGSFDTGILSMPFAIMSGGFSFGIIAGLVSCAISSYCSYSIVSCAHHLYYKTKTPSMTYSEVVESAFRNGPNCLQGFSKIGSGLVLFALFLGYLGIVSVYVVLTALSYQEVINYYIKTDSDVRIYIIALFPLILALCYLPNLKIIAPFSMFGNMLMGVGIGITTYYIIMNLSSPFKMRQIPDNMHDVPYSFSIPLFSICNTGQIMISENNMENPRHFLGLLGILNVTMFLLTIFYLGFGAMGYLAFEEKVQGSLTSNLESSLIGAQIARVCLGTGVLLTINLQFYICESALWELFRKRITKHRDFYHYLLRTVIIIAIVLLAILVPSIGPLVGLISSVIISFLSVMIPSLLNIITYWNTESRKKLICTNVPIILFSVTILFYGTYAGLVDIIQEYVSDKSKPLNRTDSLL